jgi:hypothetical protein
MMTVTVELLPAEANGRLAIRGEVPDGPGLLAFFFGNGPLVHVARTKLSMRRRLYSYARPPRPGQVEPMRKRIRDALARDERVTVRLTPTPAEDA